MTKSQQYFKDMMEYNKDAFEQFKKVHDAYIKDEKKIQDEFNEKGEEILRIIRKYENLLCSSQKIAALENTHQTWQINFGN